MTTKLILDTDIGSDIDDAVCLAYLLAQPQCELLGITTVTGEADRRAQMASAMCRVAGRDIPIYPGAEQCLLVPQRQPRSPQADALVRWPHETTFPHGEAIEFLRRTIRQYPGEITLLAIGPLTNIGLLFAVDREIPSLLKELVLMGGIFADRYPDIRTEWNTGGDPHATAIVFGSTVPRVRAIGLDVTLQVTMPAGEIRQRFDVPLLRPVLDFAEVWFKDADRITFHDPLAATTIFDDAICTFEKGTVTADLDREPGRTWWQPGGAKPPHEIAVAVDAPRFFEHYFGVVAATSPV
jgi:purine nucleosidase